MSERSIDDAIREAVSAYRALSPVDRALHDSAQRRSFVRGQMGSEPPRDVLADEVVRLRALLAECEAVLEPFSDIADQLDLDVADSERVVILEIEDGEEIVGHATLSMADFRAARTLAAKIREAREG